MARNKLALPVPSSQSQLVIPLINQVQKVLFWGLGWVVLHRQRQSQI